ncbi:MAG: hypothetical protein ACRCVG_00730 [Methanobacteriaceae archaeon]
MSRYVNSYYKSDLRKRNQGFSSFDLNQVDIKSCVALLLILGVFALSIISIIVSPNPTVLFGL